jgi:transposase
MSRGSMEMFESTQKQIVKRLLSEHSLQQRVERLLTIRGVGPITALTWALEVSDPHRFSSIGDAVSYCGLTAPFRSSAGKEQRGPISKQRNAWLQTVLIEAAKLAPRWNPQLAALHARQLELGHPNRATLQVARKLVAYLLAVDKSGQPFRVLAPPTAENSMKTKRRKRTSISKAA